MERVYPWTKTDYARVGKQSRLFMVDSGLMASLLSWKMEQLRLDSDRSGKLIETFAFNKMLLPELKKSSYVYTGILMALGKGIQDATEISNYAGINTSSLGNYLPYLIYDLDLIYKEIPVTEKPSSKNSRYVIKDPFILFWYRYMEKYRTLLELGQTHRVVHEIKADLPNIEGRVLEMIFREKILADPPMSFDVAGSVFRNRQQIEIDFLLAGEKENRIHAYEIMRGNVDHHLEVNRLISKASRLHFKSIQLRNPQITGEILTLKDM